MDETERVELHELNPTGRFTDRAADYRRFRPDYPGAAIDRILDGLGPAAHLVVADVGAGTGISARQVADRGARVVAVEPNAAMRAAAAPHERVEWRDGTAEATGLDAGGTDLVLCAQAFHWFHAPHALAEFHRVLVPGGRLAIMWNSRDRADPLTRSYVEAIRAIGGDHPAEMRPFDPRVIARSDWFAEPTRHTFAHAQTLDREGLIGRAVSASYVPRDGAAHERLLQLLDDAWQRHRDERGEVRMRYETEVYLTTRLEGRRVG